MAYNRVLEPRFYIDEIQYLQSIGFDFEKYYEDNNFPDMEAYETYLDNINLFGLKANNQKSYNIESPSQSKSFVVPSFIKNIEGNNIGRYTAILNHSLGKVVNESNEIMDIRNNWLYKVQQTGTSAVWVSEEREYDVILNSEYPYKSGNTIFGISSQNTGFNPPQNEGDNYSENFYHTKILLRNFASDEGYPISIGSISNGIYYDLRSPDLDIKMTTEFDGYDSVSTLGGASLTNIRYSGSPFWFDLDGNKKQPFQVGDEIAVSKLNGRRVWNIKFSHMSDTDIFSSNNMLNNYYEHSSTEEVGNTYNDAGDLDESADAKNFRYTLEEDNSFMSQVINRIGNGQKFIFQPDKNNNNPDQFAICVLDMDEFSVTQVAYRTYDFNLTIREAW